MLCEVAEEHNLARVSVSGVHGTLMIERFPSAPPVPKLTKDEELANKREALAAAAKGEFYALYGHTGQEPTEEWLGERVNEMMGVR